MSPDTHAIRRHLEEKENQLHPRAARSVNSSRQRPEKPSPVRTEFQRDRDRILHSKSFRRLKHKTQVFISPEGDHYRTRLTHTLELSQISRTIARALDLNEDLAEAISLGHDLGHTPFGHGGEAILDEITPGGFRHYEQSLRVVDKLEYDGRGLNLTLEVRDGIVKHSKGMGPVVAEQAELLPLTLEGQVVRLSDLITYVNHDLDDALRAGLITDGDIPESAKKRLGRVFAKRIDTVVIDVIEQTLANGLARIAYSPDVFAELLGLRDFLFERVYARAAREQEGAQVRDILLTLYDHVSRNPEGYVSPFPAEDSLERRTTDFIAGMTDRYAIRLYRKLRIPEMLV